MITMASKKSKVLAIAFCAAVMAGIHVNPVLAYSGADTHVRAGAANVNQETGKVTMDLVNKKNTTVGKVTIDGLASDKELEGVKKELQEQINNIDVEDTNTQIKEGTYTAEADGTVNMDVVDKVTGKVTENAVTIEGLASDKELETERQNRTDADTKLQEQINDNATAIATETQNRTDADTKLQKQINDNATAIRTEQMLIQSCRSRLMIMQLL